MIKNSLFFVVTLVQFSSSQQTKITKCLKPPDTWKKVDDAIKECQENVKLKIIEDTFYSNEWDESIFEHDDHIPSWNLAEHEKYQSIIDHFQTDDHHHPFHNHCHPQTHNQNYPAIHDHIHPLTDFHLPSTHGYQTPIDHHPAKNEYFTSIHNYETPVHHHHPLQNPIVDLLPDHLPDTEHDAHQIEAPQPMNLQPFVHSTQGGTEHNVHGPSYLSSDEPVKQDHYIDFNDFRKKRHTHDHGWVHPSIVTNHNKRIAGCIMQCIYEKNHAVDKLGWPTLDGLVNFYSEGVNEHGYFMATLRAVDYCLKGSSAKYHVNRRSTPEKGQTCDVAFDVFDCISDQITDYCSDHHSN